MDNTDGLKILLFSSEKSFNNCLKSGMYQKGKAFSCRGFIRSEISKLRTVQILSCFIILCRSPFRGWGEGGGEGGLVDDNLTSDQEIE